ncbi:DUF6093 family protein [Leucobacter rhizosphaerae]|uniref:DUF6093 family protein n=1 Tax=Leucobacter rhizosphaerae TaxID=2932245 RepID=A0ABY4FVR1_9MICO|nr:DUF6093 family protein [Leucobacter rhizosphaerae]UOQ60382.1 DUF6093 family protein [Leucobacter rhizosphaerae]
MQIGQRISMSLVGVGLGCTVGADIDLMMARREAERNMRDRCRVTRISKGTALDEDTGKYPNVSTVIYEGAGGAGGKARLKHPRMAAKEVDAGSQLLVSTSLELQVPVASEDFAAGDVVEMTACPDRPNQVGRKFKVIGPFDGSQTTALRYRVEAFDGR